MHPKGLIENRGDAVLEIAEEGLHGRQPCVARTGLVAARFLDMFEEGKDHRHVEILDLQQARPLVQSSRGERHQQLEAVGIGIARMNAGAPFAGKVLAKEGGQVWGELAHAGTPRCKTSPAAAMCAISSGVASRYQ